MRIPVEHELAELDPSALYCRIFNFSRDTYVEVRPPQALKSRFYREYKYEEDRIHGTN